MYNLLALTNTLVYKELNNIPLVRHCNTTVYNIIYTQLKIGILFIFSISLNIIE